MNSAKQIVFGAIGGALLMLAIALIISSCAPMTAKAAEPQVTKNIPAMVDGIVTDHLPWDDTIPVEERAAKVDLFRIVVHVDRSDATYPVDAETWARSEVGQEIRLDCDPLPCTMDGG